MAKRAVLYIAMTLALAITLQGCYTMIRHPKLDYVDHSTEYYSENCFNCHENLDQYPYGNTYASCPGYLQSYQNWGRYYSFPWWWESFWWDIQVSNTENDYEPLPGDGIGPRRGLFPGDIWQLIPAPNEITGQTPPSGGDSSGTAAGSDDNGGTKTKDPNDKPEQKEPAQKPERRRLPQ